MCRARPEMGTRLSISGFPQSRSLRPCRARDTRLRATRIWRGRPRARKSTASGCCGTKEILAALGYEPVGFTDPVELQRPVAGATEPIGAHQRGSTQATCSHLHGAGRGAGMRPACARDCACRANDPGGSLGERIRARSRLAGVLASLGGHSGTPPADSADSLAHWRAAYRSPDFRALRSTRRHMRINDVVS